MFAGSYRHNTSCFPFCHFSKAKVMSSAIPNEANYIKIHCVQVWKGKPPIWLKIGMLVYFGALIFGVLSILKYLSNYSKKIMFFWPWWRSLLHHILIDRWLSHIVVLIYFLDKLYIYQIFFSLFFFGVWRPHGLSHGIIPHK